MKPERAPDVRVIQPPICALGEQMPLRSVGSDSSDCYYMTYIGRSRVQVSQGQCFCFRGVAVAGLDWLCRRPFDYIVC